MTDRDDKEVPFSKAELMKRIHQSFAELEDTIRSLDEAQLSRPGPSGWAIKDHLTHLATWELGIAELLQRRSRFAAMQVQDAFDQGKSEDEINDLIFRRHAGKPAAEAKQMFHDAHTSLLQAIEPLSDEDLTQPYASYLPEGNQGPQKPVWYWIVGNTNGHFDEHRAYIHNYFNKL